MPRQPSRPCSVPGCPLLVAPGGECSAHPRVRHRDREASRPDSSSRGYDRAWAAISRGYLARHRQCAWCSAKATVTDHIVPRRVGGSNAPSNLQALCRRCHALKTARETRR